MQTETILQPVAHPVVIPRQAVEDQLKRLLDSTLFNHSRRYPGFLRYVVDQVLSGRQNELKERTIGIEVFSRAPDYDLNMDPVVRVTAGEVRKRLAQYYYEAEHQTELRIELRPGSYIPEFKFAPTMASQTIPASSSRPNQEAVSEFTAAAVTLQPKAAPSPDALSPTESAGSLVETTAESSTKTPAKLLARIGSHRLLALSALASIIVVAAILAIYFVDRAPSPLDRLWKPIVKSPAPVLIAVGSWGPSASDASELSISAHAKSSEPIALADTVAIASLQQLLSQHGKPVQIQTSPQTSFSDLQRGTTILISGFDNLWTMRLTDPLRFHFVIHSQDVLAIEDRNDPTHIQWQIDTKTPYASLTHDYGIIARFHDPTTEQMIVVAAGIGENGTIAAGELLTNEQYLASAGLTSGLYDDYRNMEAVVETQVIEGKPGPPRIVALHFW